MNHSNSLKEFQEQKVDHETYLRVLQGLAIRSSRVYNGRMKQTLAYNHLLEYLVSNRKSSLDLEHLIQQLCEQPSPTMSVTMSANNLPKEVTLYVGQSFETPLGYGKIIFLDADKKVATMHLPYDGNTTKVATFFEVAKWKPVSDPCKLSALSDRWDSELKHDICMKPEDANRIEELLLNQVDESEGTDNDVSSEVSYDESDNDEDSSDEKNSSCDNAGDDAKDHDLRSSRDLFQANSLNFESEVRNEFFPLLTKQPAITSRQIVMEELFHAKQQVLNLDALKVAIAPIGKLCTSLIFIVFSHSTFTCVVGCISTLAEEYWKPNTKQYQPNPNRIILDMTALDSSKSPSYPLGTTGSLAWNGDIGGLQEKLREAAKYRNDLERDRNLVARQV